jgi:hypothetical protein
MIVDITCNDGNEIRIDTLTSTCESMADLIRLLIEATRTAYMIETDPVEE